MLQATMPTQFWPFSILIATYVVNRLPTSTLKWKTPYEVIFGKRPNYSSLKIFGCLSYATNTRPHKSKFEPRATKCVFLGFSPGQKAYKLYSLDTKQIIISRDVVFYENIFPFQSMKHDNNSDLSLPSPTDGALLENDPADDDEADPQVTLAGTIDQAEQNNNLERRHSVRERKPPNWLNDFVFNASITNDPSNNYSYSKLDSTHKTRACSTYIPCTFPYTISHNLGPAYVNFLTNVSAVCEPSSYDQAKQSIEWVKTMNTKIEALEKNKTWRVTELPPGK